MSHRIVLRIEAEHDLADARDWYDERQAGLGDDFLAQIDSLLTQIQQNPLRFERIYQEFRRALVRRFPYAVFFTADNEYVTVYGVFHCAREPAKWRRRLP